MYELRFTIWGDSPRRREDTKGKLEVRIQNDEVRSEACDEARRSQAGKRRMSNVE